MENYFGIKELYDVNIRATFPININGKDYDTNESIIKFDKIQLAPLSEVKKRVYATGGYGNAQLVEWESTKEVDFVLSEGVISKIGLALLSNSILEKKKEGEQNLIPFNEILESNEDGKIQTKYLPIVNKETFFLYELDTGNRIKDYTIEEDLIQIKDPFKEVIVDYQFSYTNQAEVLTVGKRLINGYLKLDGKLRLKDDFDGHTKTGIIEIPKIKLMSDLSMRLGSDATPYVYQFQIVGLPVGERGNQYVCKIIMLDNEIDSDL